MKNTPKAVLASSLASRKTKSSYPAPFADVVLGRDKKQLGEAFGLQNFGVNLTTLAPGAASALLHKHTTQDEFIYIIDGTPTLRTEEEEIILSPGMCAGFPAKGEAHQLINLSEDPSTYLEIGDRSEGDSVTYPEDDLKAVFKEGRWQFFRKNGDPF